MRGRHQGDEPAYGIEPDAREVEAPVDNGELGDRRGVRAQDMDGGAERPGVLCDGIFHGGSYSCPTRGTELSRNLL